MQIMQYLTTSGEKIGGFIFVFIGRFRRLIKSQKVDRFEAKGYIRGFNIKYSKKRKLIKLRRHNKRLKQQVLRRAKKLLWTSNRLHGSR